MRMPPLRRSVTLPGVIVAMTVLLVGAGAVAAFESRTVGSYWEGLWWALGVMTTVGFDEGSPETVGGAVTSAVLMVAGFLLLSLISAALASLFVREDEEPIEEREEAVERQILDRLAAIERRLEGLDRHSADGEAPEPEPEP